MWAPCSLARWQTHRSPTTRAPAPPAAGADAASSPAAAARGPDPASEGLGSAPGLAADGADSSTGGGAAEATSEQELAALSARGALAAAHAGTRLPGSSTACVLQLNRAARTVSAANLVRPGPPGGSVAGGVFVC